jgi:hypothetical protein
MEDFLNQYYANDNNNNGGCLIDQDELRGREDMAFNYSFQPPVDFLEDDSDDLKRSSCLGADNTPNDRTLKPEDPGRPMKNHFNYYHMNRVFSIHRDGEKPQKKEDRTVPMLDKSIRIKKKREKARTRAMVSIPT